MIRYFTYYSCGGYKDIYVGSDNDSATASYFIPLLNVWKKSNKPENAEKISRAERLQHIELVTKNNSAGFPTECSLMFSHGGYKAIYRTLNDGRVCLCIRDIQNGMKDEEGRDIPFNFMFLADGQESIKKLDGLALEYLSKSKEIDVLIANAISYDYKVNGVKFDLSKLDTLVSSVYKDTPRLYHQAGTIDYLKIGFRNQVSIALKEQWLDSGMVKSAWDSNGIFFGSLQYLKEQKEETEEDQQGNSGDIQEVLIDTADTEIDGKHQENIFQAFTEETNEKASGKSTEEITASEVGSIIEFHIRQLEQQLSLLAKSEEIERIKVWLENNSTDSNSESKDTSSIHDDLQEQSTDISLISNPPNASETISKNKLYVIAAGCLIVGFILGALIF